MNKFSRPLMLLFRNSCLLILLFLASGSLAQDTWSTPNYAASVASQELKAQRIVPPAPEAAELGKYGNIPISMYTGSASISVPIYEIAGSRLKLPISLSYNSSGFKPQETAGWAGLGWSVNAGGVITRSVAGNPDIAANYFNSLNYLTAKPPTSTDLFANYNYMKLVGTGQYESQPDAYFFNFAGQSGSFYINPNQTIVKKQSDNLVITPTCLTCATTSNVSFTVVDADGVVYQFTDYERANTTLDDGPGSVGQFLHSFDYDSSWYLTSMTSPDGLEQITFNYLTTTAPHTQYQDFLPAQSVNYSLKYPPGGSTYTQTINTTTPPTVKTYRKYLQSITYLKNRAAICKVLFETGTNQRADLQHQYFPGEQLLNDIKVYSYIQVGGVATQTLIKQFNMTYSYFGTAAATDTLHKRLRLDKVQEMNVVSGGVSKPPYSFTYNNAAVPQYGLASIDAWGYGNGGEVTTLVPTVSGLGLNANRTPDLASTLNTVMTQVNYPTGGSTIFTYELNDAKDGNGNLFAVGGLRVKQTADYAFGSSQKAVAKTFSYKLNDSTSSGLAFVPQYLTTSTYNYYPTGTWGGGYNPAYSIGNTTISASTISGLGSFDGSLIRYSQVISYLTDISTGLPLGKTVTNYDPGTIDGKLIEQQDLDKDGRLLEEQDNTYGTRSGAQGIGAYTIRSSSTQDNATTLCRYTVGSTTFDGWKLQTDVSPTCIKDSVVKSKTFYNGVAYTIQWLQLVDQVDKKFDPVTNSYVLDEKQYTYGNPAHTFPTIIHEKTGSKDWLITNKKYAADYTITGSTPDAQSTAIQLLQSKNMVGTEIETSQFLTDSVNTSRYVAGVLKFYLPTQPYLSQLYQLQTVTPLSTLTTSTSTAGVFSYDSHYQPWGSISYDAYGNVTQQSRTNGAPTAYIWDYYNALPIAEVKAATTADIAYTSFEADGTGGWVIPTTTRDTTQFTGNVCYDLLSGNTISKNGLTGTKQYIVSYWSKSGALTVTTNIGTATAVASQVHNGWTCYQHTLATGSTTVSLTTTATKTIDELRLFPVGALMSTTAYLPLVGVTDMSGPTNALMKYHYDGLGRLSLVTNEDANIVKHYQYNYGTAIAAPTAAPTTLFYNSLHSQTFTRTTACPDTSHKGQATYTVLYATYASAISQADADNQAQADINANGQNYANANGPCLWFNYPVQKRFFKTDCLPSQGGSSGVYFYKVAWGTYSSTISQADADAQAQADINTNGQNVANQNLSCSCGGEGQSYINGVCETGTRYNSSSTLMPDGTWQCKYYYQFSDGSISQYYYSYSSSPCPIQ